jgi:hypothetical protein
VSGCGYAHGQTTVSHHTGAKNIPLLVHYDADLPQIPNGLYPDFLLRLYTAGLSGDDGTHDLSYGNISN